ncbi:MAG: phosphoribosylglycinamide formyltransferase [Bacteroidales bacterium]|nr:phosphoribosylglycinamide formyltransferase [Bacteroidales bacterium]
MTKNISIFASGSGTNAENIILYFRKNKNVLIKRIYCNKPEAFVLKRAEKYNIPSTVFNKKDFYESGKILENLLNDHTRLIVLAGFLWFIPHNILLNFPDRILNIHPALLPKYGGKGMYGHYVHEAVIRSGDKESGITIHYVNEKYDEGEILFQARCRVPENNDPESLASRIHELEYLHYPRIIEQILLKQ